MKKLFISLGLALGLWGLTSSRVQAEIVPWHISTYNVTSQVGTFTDISTNPNAVALGADLADGTDLLKTTFAGIAKEDGTTDATPACYVTTATSCDDQEPIIAGFPLGFEFNLCGKKMTHFVVSAFGGVYFSDSNRQGQYTTTPSASGRHAVWACPYLTKSKTSQPGIITSAGFVTKTAGKTPAYYLIEGTEGNHVLTVQHHYDVRGHQDSLSDSWVFQFKFYEATGKIDFIVKDLPANNALTHNTQGKCHRLLISLSNYTTYPKTFPDGEPYSPTDPFAAPAGTTPGMRIQGIDNSNHRIIPGQSDAAFAEKGWDTITLFGNHSTPATMRIEGNGPEEGRTISFTPQNAPETVEPFTADHYTQISETVTENSYTAQYVYTAAMFPTLDDFMAAGPIFAVISENETPDYTLENGTLYWPDHEFAEVNGFKPKVIANMMPKVTPTFATATYGTPNSWKYPATNYTVELKATGLKKQSVYYIHLYRMAYAGTNAPVYSPVCHTITIATAFNNPKTLEAGLADIDGVNLKVAPADDENLGVIVIKSNTPNVKPSGQLKKGDKIGENAEVLELLTEEKEWKLPLTYGEGCFIIAISVNIADENKYVYAPTKKYIAVGTAYNGLPGVIDFTTMPYGDPNYEYNGFNKRSQDWQKLQPTIYRDLPFGWTRTEIEGNKARDFGLGKPASKEASGVYAWTVDGVNLITPPIVADKDRILVTFNARWVDNDDILFDDRSFGKSTNTETLCQIEYAIGDGEWQMGKLFYGYDEVFTERDDDGYYAVSYALIADENTSFIGQKVRFRFTSKTTLTGSMGAAVLVFLGSVDIKEDKICQTAKNIVLNDELTTSSQLGLSWDDPNEEDLSPAESFEIAYKPASDENAAWRTKTVNAANATIENLDINTIYLVQITANCGTWGKAYTSKTAQFSTTHKFPFTDDLAQEDPETIMVDGSPVTVQGKTPFDRGVTTFTGALPEEGYATLATASYGWKAFASSARLIENGKQSNSVGIREDEKTGWLLMPTTYIPVYDAVYPQTIRFKANSAYKYADDTEWTLGSIGSKYTDAKLYILVSHNGKFSMDDTVATIAVSDETIDHKAFEFEVPASLLANGRTQVAFFFDNPKASPGTQSTSNDDMMLFEIYDFEFLYSENACVPAENLVCANTTVDEASFTWEGYSKSYKFFWGLRSEEGYMDSVTLTETAYTLTGLTENTRYKVKVVGICGEDGAETTPDLTIAFTTMESCHVPEAFAVSGITQTGATFSSTNEQTILTQRLVYLSIQGDTVTKIFVQTEDQLKVNNLLDKTVYVAQTQSVCGPDSSELSEPITFTTLADSFLIMLNIMPDDNAGTVTGAGRYEKGSQATVTATAAEGYEFVAWLFGNDTASKEATYTFNVTAGGTYTALFVETFNITLNVLPNENAGTVTGAGRYRNGQEATLTATPAKDYDFVAWLSGNDTASKEATYTFNVTADGTYTALFVEKTANEEAIRAAFNVSTKEGHLLIQNLKGLTIEEVTVYGLTGRQIGRFTPNSREDLSLPINAERALLLVRVASEKGVTIYKVYLH